MAGDDAKTEGPRKVHERFTDFIPLKSWTPPPPASQEEADLRAAVLSHPDPRIVAAAYKPLYKDRDLEEARRILALAG
jgi:hypothetical protein